MKKAIIFLLVPAYILYYNCWKNHSEMLKELGSNFNEGVVLFYKTHQRYPNHNEIVSVLNDSGCKNAEIKDYSVSRDLEGAAYLTETKYSCESFYFMETRVWAKAKIEATLGIPILDRVDFGKGETGCVMFIEDKGKSSHIADCSQQNCLLNIGH